MHKNIFMMLLSLVLMNFSPPSLAAKDEPKQKKEKETYLVIYRPGPDWLEGKSLGEQPLQEHGMYMLTWDEFAKKVKASTQPAAPAKQ